MKTIVNSFLAGRTNARQLAAFERYIGYRLPRAYRTFLLRYNGGYPEPDAFILPKGRRKEEHVVFCFFPLRELSLGKVNVKTSDDLSRWPLHCAWDDLQSDANNSTSLDTGMTLWFHVVAHSRGPSEFQC